MNTIMGDDAEGLAKEIMERLDADGGGGISFIEFANMMVYPHSAAEQARTRHNLL